MATISKHGSGYRVQIRRKGYPTHSSTFATKAAARQWALQVEAKMDAGDYLAPEGRRVSLAEALTQYLNSVTPTKKGAKQEAARIRQWLRDPLAQRPLAAIRSMDVATWRDKRVAEGKAPTTIKNALTILSQVYVVASTDWGIEGLKNPVAGVKMPKARQGRSRRLEPGEEERLLVH